MPAVPALETNTPNRTDLWWLSTDDGESLLDIQEDTKIPNAATIKVLKQDHTLANMLRAQLLCNPEVLFAGYRAPHPLEPHFLLKIQTTAQSTPIVALREASFALLLSIDKLKKQVGEERKRVETDAVAVGAGAVAADELDPAPAAWNFAGPQGASQGAGWGFNGGDMDF